MKMLIRVVLTMTTAAMLMGVQCLPDNYWFGKGSSYFNQGLDAVVQYLVTAATSPS